MKIIKRIGIVLCSIILIGLLSFLYIFRFGFLQYSINEFNIPSQKEYADWNEVFKSGKEMQVNAFKAGEVVEDPVHPIYSYYVKHPEQGDLLFDAGLDKAFYTNPPYGSEHLGLIINQMLSKSYYKQDADQNIGFYLNKYNINPNIVFMTHLHPDHACGLLEINNSAKIVFGKNETSFFHNAIAGKYIDKKNLYSLDFNKGISIYPFDKVIDIFGDGSIWAVSTPGHSTDHISYLINIKNNPVLIIGDVSSSKDNLINNVEYNSTDDNIEQNSFKEVKEFKNTYPNLKIYFTHSDEAY